MDFGLSPEQRLLVDTLRRYLEEEAPWGRVRDIMRRDTAHDPLLWQGLAALGVPGVLVPAAYGGSGLALLDAVLIAETLAQGALPVPFLGSAVLAPLALLAAGTPAPQQAWLPQLASGRACIGVALAEQVGGREGAGMVLRDGRLFGKALFVLDAAAADAFLVATREGDLVLVPREAPGLRLTLLPTVDETRRLGELVCEAAPADCLGSRGEGEAVIARLLAAAWLVLAAEILGASERALDMAVAYAKERRQFGRPIGSFQAVKHSVRRDGGGAGAGAFASLVRRLRF
ncbi:MAG: hypothetical protein KatS3mg131_3409 [Candidatus Tectimicrobiota bacterium]|nr:MAG: hypothetical protein KatS3mg131_3409 [Candidatus Tectomicrobia bacterium]